MDVRSSTCCSRWMDSSRLRSDDSVFENDLGGASSREAKYSSRVSLSALGASVASVFSVPAPEAEGQAGAALGLAGKCRGEITMLLVRPSDGAPPLLLPGPPPSPPAT